jgi:hypothetical protein
VLKGNKEATVYSSNMVVFFPLHIEMDWIRVVTELTTHFENPTYAIRFLRTTCNSAATRYFPMNKLHLAISKLTTDKISCCFSSSFETRFMRSSNERRMLVECLSQLSTNNRHISFFSDCYADNHLKMFSLLSVYYKIYKSCSCHNATLEVVSETHGTTSWKFLTDKIIQLPPVDISHLHCADRFRYLGYLLRNTVAYRIIISDSVMLLYGIISKYIELLQYVKTNVATTYFILIDHEEKTILFVDILKWVIDFSFATLSMQHNNNIFFVYLFSYFTGSMKLYVKPVVPMQKTWIFGSKSINGDRVINVNLKILRTTIRNDCLNWRAILDRLRYLIYYVYNMQISNYLRLPINDRHSFDLTSNSDLIPCDNER